MCLQELGDGEFCVDCEEFGFQCCDEDVDDELWILQWWWQWVGGDIEVYVCEFEQEYYDFGDVGVQKFYAVVELDEDEDVDYDCGVCYCEFVEVCLWYVFGCEFVQYQIGEMYCLVDDDECVVGVLIV